MSAHPENRSAARDFAERWIAEWNRKDVDAVLAFFHPDVVFTSPRAQAIVGSARIEGKTRLREYWTRAITKIQTLHFELDSVIAENDRIAILYTSEISGTRMRCVEFLTFGSDGLIREGEAMHGIVL